MSPASGSRAAGFTLIEVVVALTLMSLVMLATVSGMRTLANTQKSLEQVILRVDEVRSVSTFLRDHLEMAVVGSAGAGGLTLGGSTAEQAFFKGSARAVAWKAPVLFGEGYGGVHLLRVGLEENRVVLRWQRQPVSAQRIVWSGTPDRTLLDNVEVFKPSYRADISSEWVSNWEQKENPGFVRFQIRARDRDWPDIIMQVQK